MTLALFLYSLAVSLVLGAVGLLAERLFLRWDTGTRGIWTLVLLASGSTPLAALLLGADQLHLLADTSEWLSARLALPLEELQHATTRLQFLADYFLPDLAYLLAGVWAVSALVLVLWLAASWWRLRSRRRGWEEGAILGVPCLVSREVGPGLVGFFRTRLVVPRWVMELDESRQAMVLAHEREHRRVRDPWLVSAGYAAVMLAPWNPVVWWQLRRLRLAVEMDCDHRVLESGGSVREYGGLLLDLAQRGPQLVTAFASTESHLVRRVRRLGGQLRPSPRRAAVTGVGALAAAALLWAVPLPVSTPPPPGEVTTAREVVGHPTPFEEAPDCLNCASLGIGASGPGAGGRPAGEADAPTLVAVYVSEEGSVEGSVCVRGCRDRSRDSPSERLSRLRYDPARIWGVPVPTWGIVAVRPRGAGDRSDPAEPLP